MVVSPLVALPTRRLAVLACLLAIAGLLLGACSAESAVTITDSASDTEAATTDEPPADRQPADEPVADEPATDEPAADDSGDADADADDDGEAADEPASDGDDLPTDMAPGDVIVRLLDPGSEPRQLLRLDLPPSCAELMIIDQTQEFTQKIGTLEVPSSGPIQSTMIMRLTSTSLGPDGYEIIGEIVSAMAGPDTDPAAAAAMDAEFAKLEGIRTISQVTDRAIPIPGTMRTEGAEALGPLGDIMDQMNSQMSSPLPEEPIGVGGSWEIINMVELQGLPTVTRTVQTIEAIDGSIVTTTTVGAQTVPVGAEMDVPGASLAVLQWDNDVTGSLTLDLQSLVPVASQARVEAFQSFATDDSGGTLDQGITMQMNVEGQLEDGCAARPGRARP